MRTSPMKTSSTTKTESLMHDPLFVMTETIHRLETEVNRWKNIAGIMHQAIIDGDCDMARNHYEISSDKTI